MLLQSWLVKPISGYLAKPEQSIGLSISSLKLGQSVIRALENDPDRNLIAVKPRNGGTYLSIAVGYEQIVARKVAQLQHHIAPDLSHLTPLVEQLPLCWPKQQRHKRILSALFTSSSKKNTPIDAEQWAAAKGLEVRSNAVVFIRCDELIEIEKADGSQLSINPSESLNKELIFNDKALDSIKNIRLASGEALTLVTIENFAAYQHLALQPGEIALHQPGFDDRYTAVVLQKLTPTQVFHCGDLDLQGIQIAKRLARFLSVPFYLLVPKHNWLTLLAEHFSIPISTGPADNHKKGQKNWPAIMSPPRLHCYLSELIASERWLEQETFILFQRQELDLILLAQDL